MKIINFDRKEKINVDYCDISEEILNDSDLSDDYENIDYEIDTKETIYGNKLPIHKLPKLVNKWASDNSIENCENCKRKFTLWLGKHHCRLCGKIFCEKCSSYRQKIPEELLSEESKTITWNDFFSSHSYDKKRVCVACNIEIERINQVKKIIEVFRIIKMNVLELYKAKDKCVLWKYAANYCLSKFRDIQYKLPNDKLNDIEKDLLWANLGLINGHSKYILAILKTCKNVEEVNKVKEILDNNEKEYINSKIMMSSKNSKKCLSSRDAIELLSHCFNNKDDMSLECNKLLKNVALEFLNCSDIEISCYIPLLVYHLKDDVGEIISKYLITRCVENFDLLNTLFWELTLYPKNEYPEKCYAETLIKLNEYLSEKKYHETFVNLIKGAAFTDVIKKIGIAICENGKHYSEIKDEFNLMEDLIYPLNPNIKICKIHLEHIKYKNSMSRPIIIPCETNEKTITNLMYKKDNLRNDQIVMNLIRLVQILVKDEEGIDLDVVTYNILPLSRESGLIEMVDNADTVFYIEEKLKSTILTYMLEKNENVTIAKFRDTYIKSAAVYSVITFLLGVGDRHLDNIMITRDARMFHIDFGYILGQDPVFNNPGIRITPDMIEAIGGLCSKYYSVFIDLCSKIYNCLRRNVNIFMTMLLLLPKISDMKMTEQEIKDQIIKRFLPGEEEHIAHFHLVQQLESHSCTDRIKDWFHYHSKEQTVNSAMNRLTYAFTTISGIFKKKKITYEEENNNEKNDFD